MELSEVPCDGGFNWDIGCNGFCHCPFADSLGLTTGGTIVEEGGTVEDGILAIECGVRVCFSMMVCIGIQKKKPTE